MKTILHTTPLLCLLAIFCFIQSGCCCLSGSDEESEPPEASAASADEEAESGEVESDEDDDDDDDTIDEELEESASEDEEEEAGPMGPCPKDEACEDGYNCTCSLDSSDRVVKRESRKRRTGALKEVTTHYYNDKGFLIRTESDGGIWNRKAKIDGEPDQVWVFTYDENDYRVTQETWTKGDRKNLLCNHNGNCPPPHDLDKCYRGRYKCKDIPARPLIP